MKITTSTDRMEYTEPRHHGSWWSVIAITFGLLTMNLVGCSAVSGFAHVHRVPCLHGCQQAPLKLRDELKSGNSAAEIAMAQREMNAMHLGNAEFWLRQAAAQGDPTAEFNVGLDYARGLGTKEDSAKSIYWYRKAAAQGYLYAGYEIGLDYQYGRGVTRNFVQAIQWFRKAAVGGLADAQYALGYDIGLGLGVAQNYAIANYWFRKAARQGLGIAEAALATDYFTGKGCRKNPIAGTLWLRKAAAQGVVIAEYDLGYTYQLGEGVSANAEMGHYWIRKAAMSGFPPAEAALGIDYALGRGTAKNYQKSYAWLRRAGTQNVAIAEYYLGAAYYRGEGVAKSAAKARWWWKKARASGPLPEQGQWCRANARKADFARVYNRAIQTSSNRRPAGSKPPQIRSDFPSSCGFYPEISKILGQQGTAIVRICIGKNGRLAHSPTIVRSSGVRRLDVAALRFARATSGYWIPAEQHGKPIGMCEKWPVRFKLWMPINGVPDTMIPIEGKVLNH